MTKRAIFIDRDGVINVDVTPYLARAEQLQIFPYAMEAMSHLAKAGFDIFVVSNQQGVALGITTQEELESITNALKDSAAERGFDFKKFYYCTARDSENHPWRKPSPGMLLSAAEEYNLDLQNCYFIGDKWSDIECGARAGAHPLLVLSGVTPPGAWSDWHYKPEGVFPTLAEAATWVVHNPDPALSAAKS